MTTYVTYEQCLIQEEETIRLFMGVWCCMCFRIVPVVSVLFKWYLLKQQRMLRQHCTENTWRGDTSKSSR